MGSCGRCCSTSTSGMGRGWDVWLPILSDGDGSLDVWLCFWRPTQTAAERLRLAMIRAGIASDADDIARLRLIPVFVDRQDGTLDVMRPNYLYSDEVQFPVIWAECGIAGARP